MSPLAPSDLDHDTNQRVALVQAAAAKRAAEVELILESIREHGALMTQDAQVGLTRSQRFDVDPDRAVVRAEP